MVNYRTKFINVSQVKSPGELVDLIEDVFYGINRNVSPRKIISVAQYKTESINGILVIYSFES